MPCHFNCRYNIYFSQRYNICDWKKADLVCEEDPLCRIVILGVNPRVTAMMNRATWEAIDDNFLEKHLLVVLILYQDSTYLPKIYWNFEICLVYYLSFLPATPVCIPRNLLLLLSSFFITKLNKLINLLLKKTVPNVNYNLHLFLTTKYIEFLNLFEMKNLN